MSVISNRRKKALKVLSTKVTEGEYAAYKVIAREAFYDGISYSDGNPSKLVRQAVLRFIREMGYNDERIEQFIRTRDPRILKLS